METDELEDAATASPPEEPPREAARGGGVMTVGAAAAALRELLEAAQADPVAFVLDREPEEALLDAVRRLRYALMRMGAASWRGARPVTEEVTSLRTTPISQPEVVQRVVLSPERLEELRAGMQPGFVRAADDNVRAAAVARSILDSLGPTPDLLGWRVATNDIGALDELVTRIDTWGELPQQWNFALTNFATKRARAAQEAIVGRTIAGDPGRRVDGVIKRLTKHSQTSRPGFIVGLRFDAQPESASWLDDARQVEHGLRQMLGEIEAIPRVDQKAVLDDELRRLVEEVHAGLEGDALAVRVQKTLSAGVDPTHPKLVNLLIPHVDVLSGRPTLSITRKAVQAKIDELDDEAGDEVSPLPDAWAGYVKTEGRRAVIVGGEPRPQRAEALQRVFKFSNLEWIPNSDGGQRRIQALVTRMKKGSVDLVICLRAFSSHKAYDAVFDATDVQCDRALADTYGVTQVRLAVERLVGILPAASGAAP